MSDPAAMYTPDLFDPPPTPVAQGAAQRRPLVTTGFFNTTRVTGTELAECRAAAETQEAIIYEFFRRHPRQSFSPSRLASVLPKAPLTSIRRAVTNLTTAGLLEKTDQKTVGLWNKREYCWRLRQRGSENPS
jgi:hypothetical protein